MEQQDHQIEEALRNVKVVYEFVDLFQSYENSARDYGGKVPFTMTEIHVLCSIAQNPGICIQELARIRRRGKAYISQVVKKLEWYNYVEKVTDPMDNKRKRIYPTTEGTALADAHAQFDKSLQAKTYTYLRRDCSPEEIETFFRVMQVYVNIMMAAERKRQRLARDKQQ